MKEDDNREWKTLNASREAESSVLDCKWISDAYRKQMNDPDEPELLFWLVVSGWMERKRLREGFKGYCTAQ
jgi:hypothetical protein